MKRLVTGLLTVAALSAYASAAPPEVGTDEINVPPTVRQDHVHHFRFGSHTVEFEKTTLSDIREWTGVGRAERDGDAGNARTWLCYSLPGQLVWFITTEMSGDAQAIVQVFGETVPPGDSRIDECPQLPTSARPIEFEFGWVGSSEATFRKALGAPSTVHGEWSQYLYSANEPGRLQVVSPGKAIESSDMDFHVIALVEVKFRNGKAVAVRASHVTAV